MSVAAVVLDIGNVLIEWQPERFYDGEIGEDRRREMFAAVDLHAMNDRVDLGEPFRDVIYETADAYPEFRDEIRMWHDRWIELAHPAISHSVTLTERLQSRDVPVFALSNFGVESFAYAQTQYAFLHAFDRPYISGQLRMAKPDPAIYAHVERTSGIAPENLLFADDRAENIAAAQARGWQTHLFDGPAGWAARLVAAGLLSKKDARP